MQRKPRLLFVVSEVFALRLLCVVRVIRVLVCSTCCVRRVTVSGQRRTEGSTAYRGAPSSLVMA